MSLAAFAKTERESVWGQVVARLAGAGLSAAIVVCSLACGLDDARVDAPDMQIDPHAPTIDYSPQAGSTTAMIPGQIEAEDYGQGGPGVSYHDTSSGNSGGRYRSDDVDIQATRDTGGGYNVGWVRDGEWLEYTVDVAAGSYDVELRVASPRDNAGSIRVDLGGVEVGRAQVPNTGDWQSWRTLSIRGVSLTGGNNQKLRLTMEGRSFNVNWIRFVSKGGPPSGGLPGCRYHGALGGGELKNGEALCSVSGQHRFGLSHEGQLVLWRDSQTLWSAGVPLHGTARAWMESHHGNFAVYSSSDGATRVRLWQSNTRNCGRATIEVLDEGKVVIRNDGAEAWSLTSNGPSNGANTTRIDCSKLNPPPPPPTSSAENMDREPGTKLRIGSWNVMRGSVFPKSDSEWEELNRATESKTHPLRREGFRRIVNASGSDIWVFQEVAYGSSVSTSDANMERYGDKVARHVGDSGWDGRCNMRGVCVVSRYPILRTWKTHHRVFGVLIDLPSHISSKDLLVVGVHFMKDDHAGKTASLVAEVPANTHVVVAGDFNGGPNSNRYNTVSAIPGITDSRPMQLGADRFSGTHGSVKFSGQQWTSVSMGTIDYVFVRSDSLDMAKRFILNTLILPDETLSRHGLRQLDVALQPQHGITSSVGTDHLPLFLDLR